MRGAVLDAAGSPLASEEHKPPPYDVLVHGPTGSGKTLAYLLPILSRLGGTTKVGPQRLRAVVAVPTRELAHQVTAEATALLAPGKKRRGVGGAAADASARIVAKAVGEVTAAALTALRAAPPALLVGTPQAIGALLIGGGGAAPALNSGSLAWIVLDEADELARPHHLSALRPLLEAAAKAAARPCVVAVSATPSPALTALAQEHMTRRRRGAARGAGGAASGGAPIVVDAAAAGSAHGRGGVAAACLLPAPWARPIAHYVVRLQGGARDGPLALLTLLDAMDAGTVPGLRRPAPAQGAQLREVEGGSVDVDGAADGGSAAADGDADVASAAAVGAGARGDSGAASAASASPHRTKASPAPPGLLVFVNSGAALAALERFLVARGVKPAVLGNAVPGAARNEGLAAFAAGRTRVLLATEMGARGLHLPAVGAVLNYDPPSSAREYVHRAGRTGRLGTRTHGGAGVVISFAADAAEAARIEAAATDAGVVLGSLRPAELRASSENSGPQLVEVPPSGCVPT